MSEIEKTRDDLRSSEASVRVAAAERLCIAGPAASVAAVELVQACGDADESVQTWAAAALEDMGPPDRKSIEPLVKLATSENSLVAYWAIMLLGRLGSDAESSEGVLANILTKSPDPKIREQAAWALGKIGATTDTTVNALKRAQVGGTARLVRLAQEALQQASS